MIGSPAGRASKFLLSLWSLAIPIPLLLGAGALATWSVFSQTPRLLTTFYGDMGSWLGGELWLLGLAKFLFPFVLVLGIYSLGELLGRLEGLRSRWRYPRLIASLSLATLALLVLVTYPFAKGWLAIRSFGQANASTAVVILERSIFHEQQDRWSGFVVFADLAVSQSSLPQSWPVSLLENGRSSVFYVSPEKIGDIVDLLEEGSFFEFSEQFDPRPSLDHSGLYLAFYQDGRMKRAFRRVSDRGFDQLRRMADAISAQVQGSEASG